MKKLKRSRPTRFPRTVRFSFEELEVIAGRANARGVSVSEWIRQAALKWTPGSKDLQK